mmetsp:Transcript_4065/g.11718  ORF Transcript_4065/g.11718 Transcript_4065/m.11718 type:complete len:218 (+) Transcript_4065:57-710(+)
MTVIEHDNERLSEVSIRGSIQSDLFSVAVPSGSSRTHWGRAFAIALCLIGLIACCSHILSQSNAVHLQLQTSLSSQDEMEVTVPAGYVDGERLTVELSGGKLAYLNPPKDTQPGDIIAFSAPKPLASEPKESQPKEIRSPKAVYRVDVPKASSNKILANVPGVGQVSSSNHCHARFLRCLVRFLSPFLRIWLGLVDRYSSLWHKSSNPYLQQIHLLT